MASLTVKVTRDCHGGTSDCGRLEHKTDFLLNDEDFDKIAPADSDGTVAVEWKVVHCTDGE